MTKTIGLVISIIAILLFGKSNMDMGAYYIGTCILIAGFMIGDENHKKG